MSNTIFITANWTTGALSQQTISRQYDNNRYAVQFIGYPEGDGTEELDLYLLVWMSTAPGQKPGEITPIQLNSDQWYISNYFTQQVQVIKFQLCVLNEAGTYEAHSPIFSGRIGDSLEHDGTTQDIDVSTLFDAYREYLNELIIRAGAVVIDPTLSQSGQAADAKATGDKIGALNNELIRVADLGGDTTGADYSPWTSGKTVLNTGKIGTSATNSACDQFIAIPDYASLTMITGEYAALIALYSDNNENSFLRRSQYYKNTSHVVDTTGAKYARIAFGSLDTTEANTVRLVFDYRLKEKINELTENIANAIATDFSNATAIPANTDYNNLTTPGNYFCSTMANAQSMINCPTTMGHRLTVLTTTAASHALQIINANDAERSIYIRESTDSKWNKIATSYNSVETQSSVITGDNYASVLPDANTAEVNTIYTINGNVPVQNLPDGNLNVAGASDTSGLPGGTLITYKGGTSSGNSAKVQIFISAGGLENVTYGIICVRYCRYTLGSFVWTDWSKFGNGINLRATNVQIQESRIQAGTALFSDMNNAPNNSIAQIDLDAVSMAHNPLSGHSCVLVTLSSSYISRHGQIQLCVGIDAGVKAFIRYGYQQAANDNRWTNWHQISLTDLGA